MKRFAPLLLVVLALAAVPAASADDSAPAAPPAAAAKAGHPMARIQLEMLRIRLQLVQLRYQVACHDKTSDRCAKFTQNAVDHLTKLDQNLQERIAKNCAATSTDKRCDVLAKLDQKLQDVIAKLGSGAAPGSSSSSESGLDNAAGSLAGSTKP